MTRAQAIAKLKTLYRAPYWRVGTRSSSPEDRAALAAAFEQAKAALSALDAEYQAWLVVQPEWIRWRAERADLLAKKRTAESGLDYKRFSIGESVGLFVHVTGQGDTWEETFEAAKRVEPMTGSK